MVLVCSMHVFRCQIETLKQRHSETVRVVPMLRGWQWWGNEKEKSARGGSRNRKKFHILANTTSGDIWTRKRDGNGDNYPVWSHLWSRRLTTQPCVYMVSSQTYSQSNWSRGLGLKATAWQWQHQTEPSIRLKMKFRIKQDHLWFHRASESVRCAVPGFEISSVNADATSRQSRRKKSPGWAAQNLESAPDSKSQDKKVLVTKTAEYPPEGPVNQLSVWRLQSSLASTSLALLLQLSH